MNLPDFKCSIEDNHGILIVIHVIQQARGVYGLTEWPSVFRALTRFRQLSFENTPREIHFRYQTRQSCVKQDYASQQIHRRVFGLVCVAVLQPGGDSEAEKRHILNQYNGYLAHYASTLLESRCIVFRNNMPEALPVQSGISDLVDGSQISRSREGRNGQVPIDQSTTGSLSHLGSGLAKLSVADSNGLGYDLLRPVHKSLSEANLSAAVANASATAKNSKSYIEIRLQGLLREQMSQVMEEYLLALFSSVEAKRPMSVPDKVDKDWKGSNPSLDRLEPVKKDGFKFDIGSTQKKKRLGGMRKIFGEWLLLVGLPYPACQTFAQAVDMLQSAKETLQLAAALEGWAAASYYVLPAADSQLALKLTSLDDPDRRIILTRTKAASLNGYLVNGFNLHVPDHAKDRKHCLTSDVIYDKLRLAASTYSIAEKGDLELEVSLKLARLFIFLGDRILAHKGLRQATFVKIDALPNDSTERIERFLTIAQLYEEIGFNRQAALFRLLAADRCIGPGSTPASYADAFRLTVKSLGPYGLTLSTSPTPSSGWPELQAQVYLKLAATCRTQPELYSRILLIILQTFNDVLSTTEKEELLRCLTDVIAQHGPPAGNIDITDFKLSLGVISLTKIPFIHEFNVMPLPHHLQPLMRPKLKRGMSGPFLYTPIKNASQMVVKAFDEAEFMWVANEPCTITLYLSNRLPRELRVENLTVDTADVPFEAAKASLVLPPILGPVFPVMVAGIPLEPGALTVLGYSFSIFGILNKCSIADLVHLSRNPPPRTVKIAPSLPQLKVETSWPPCDMFVDVGEPVVATASLTMYTGQRSTCLLKLLNIGKEPIESLSLVVSSTDNALAERCISFSAPALDALLPIQPGDTAELELEVWAALSFISVPAGETQNVHAESLQFVLRIDYSGGPGLVENFYRLISLAFFVDVVPSVVITQWAILSAEESEQFYLVVDFENRTDEEIEVLYPPIKKMLIVGRDRARIPALADKIPLLFSDSVLVAQHQCRRHMSEEIDLSWRFVEKAVSGRCWIGDLTWDCAQMESVSLPPVMVEFVLNNGPISDPGTRGVSADVGVSIPLEISLKSRFSTPVPGLRIHLVIREESLLAEQGSKIALLGGISDTVMNFEGSMRQSLNCQVVMLIPGVFHLDVVFELAGRSWPVTDTCLITAGSGSDQISENSTDL